MKNVMGSLLALLAVVSLAISAPVSANPQDQAKPGKVEKADAKKKEPPKPKGPATSQGGEAKPNTPEG